MAPLSREISGLMLFYGHYGSHFVENGRTIDEEMEQNNFVYDGKTLTEIWNLLTVILLLPHMLILANQTPLIMT